MPNAAICTHCGHAEPIERTNDWIVATQLARLDNPTPRVNGKNEPIAGEFHNLDCLIAWANEQKPKGQKKDA